MGQLQIIQDFPWTEKYIRKIRKSAVLFCAVKE